MYKILAVLSAIIILSSCEPINRYFHLDDDNIIEETAEFALQSQTGISIDSTPSSPE